MSKHSQRAQRRGAGGAVASWFGAALFGASRSHADVADPQRPQEPVDAQDSDSTEPDNDLPDRDLAGAISDEEASARDSVHTPRSADDDVHLASAQPQQTEYEDR